jgi:uncharacterized protein
MRFRNWNTLKRSLISSTLSLALILGSTIPALANETPPSAPVPQISPWSVPALHEGEKYGIFPMSWYYDGSFQKPIDQSKLHALVAATSAKLDLLQYKVEEELTFTPPPAAKLMTRETVLRSLYDVLDRYELPDTFEFENGPTDPITYLQNKGIVQGTVHGLELDQPCTVEQAAVLASRLVQFAYESAEEGAEGLMWKVTHGDNTLYLLGSIHLGIPEMYPLHPRVKEAYEQSDSLWVEANMYSPDQQGLAYFTQLMTYHDGTTLKDHISPQTYEKLNKAAARLNMPAQALEVYKPWAITTTLSVAALTGSPEEMAQAAALGVDSYFILNAVLSGKPVHELEGMKLQGDLLSGVSPEQQEKELNTLLDSILDDKENAAQHFKSAQLLWAEGDLAKFEESFLVSQESLDSEAGRRLLGERDQKMAAKLSELLEAEGGATHFIVVGSAHFVVKDMVIDLLRDKGYTVEFVE